MDVTGSAPSKIYLESRPFDLLAVPIVLYDKLRLISLETDDTHYNRPSILQLTAIGGAYCPNIGNIPSAPQIQLSFS
jgi:hypothetical protein